MPIDPGIALAGQPPQLVNPMAVYQQAESLRMQRESANALEEQRRAMADQRRAQTADLQRTQAEDSSLMDLFGTKAPEAITFKDLAQRVRPQRASELWKGLQALQRESVKDYGELQNVVGRGIGAIAALPEPLRQPAYDTLVKTYAAKGWIDPSQVQPYSPQAMAYYQRWAMTPKEQWEIDNPKPSPTASPGQGIYNAKTGKYDVPIPEKPPEPPAAAKEYEYAVKQGYKGTFNDYQNMDANRKRPVITFQQQREQSRDAALGSLPLDVRTALDRATMSVPAIRRGTVEDAVARSWAAGDQAGAKDMIRQAAIESEPVDTRSQIMGRRNTLAAMKDVRLMLEEMQKAGVPTNWFKGNVEDLARKLGTTQDPKYVELSTRLMDSLVQYRRAATGVQFSVRESQDYQKMFPNYRNTLPVNLATMQGLERAVETNDRTYWEHKMGPEAAKWFTAPAPSSDGGGGDLIYAKDPQGNIHSAKRGTALPAGWVDVQK